MDTGLNLGRLAMSCASLALFALLCGPASGARAAPAPHVVELPVAFQLQNTDTSGAACPADGNGYTVRGHITGPRSLLTGRAPRSIAVYLTGLDTGEWNWRLTDVPGYNWPLELAQQGQTSLTLDMLGYGTSGRPNG